MKNRWMVLLLCLCGLLLVFPSVGLAEETSDVPDQATDGYYEISSAGELLWFADQVNSGNAAYNARLTANISLESKTWTPIGSNSLPYTGSFDGDGYTISNLSYSGDAKYVGLIGYMSGGSVTNVKLENCTLTPTYSLDYTGGICGHAENCTISDCSVSDTTITAACYAGGICGQAYSSTITQCTSAANITGDQEDSSLGGISGIAKNTTFANCANTGTITLDGFTSGKKAYAGGICGNALANDPSSFSCCYNIGTISTTVTKGKVYYGGMCGTASKSTFESCYMLDTTAGNATTCSGPVKKDTTAFSSGEIAYLLNDSKSDDAVLWRQNIGTDAAPVLDSTHAIVYSKENENGTTEYYNQTVAHTHTVVTDKAVDPTCTETGLTEGSHCSVCNEVITAQTIIPATGHTKVTDEAVAATCTTAGKTAGSHCSVCETVLVAQEEIAATGHTVVTDEAVAATCTKTGLTEGSHCSVCNTVLKVQEIIPAVGHTEKTIEGYAATCTETGLTDGTKCSVCGETLTAQKTIPATGHTEETVAGKSATCTEDGLTDGIKCSVCGIVIKKQEKISAGHTVVTDAEIPATCTEAGKTEGSHCSVCDEVIVVQETIPATGHTVVPDETVAATCTETGLTEGSHCLVCGAVFTEQKEIPALGHEYDSEPTWVWSSDAQTAQATFHCTRDSSHMQTVSAIISSETVAATTESDGKTVYTAQVQFEGTTYQDQQNIAIPALEKPEVQQRITAHEDINEVPEGLRDTAYNTTAAIESELVRAVAQQDGSEEEQTAFYDVALYISTDGGESWQEATPDDFPENGLTVTLPYPDGTDAADYDFTVAHMFAEEINGHAPGDIEFPTVCEINDGLSFTVDGLSPIAISWRETECDGGTSCPSARFSDIDTAGWYHADIDYMLNKGIMNGFGNSMFSPNGAVTRAQMVQILYNWAGRPAVDRLSDYIDVSADAWYAEAIAWAEQTGVVNGYGNGKFGPNDVITREQLAVMLWRAAGKPESSDNMSGFTDTGEIGNYAVEALRWASEQGIVRGNPDGTIRPRNSATRAEAAAMVHRFLLKI